MDTTTITGRRTQGSWALSALLTFLLAFAMLPLTALPQQAQAAVGLGFAEDSIEGIPILYHVLTENAETATGTVQAGNDTGAAIAALNTTAALTIPEIVVNNGITYTVVGLGTGAFRSCVSLTSLTIPDTVTSIGNGAFNSCESLTSLTIPDTVTSIGEGAFRSCGLTSLTIPDSVASIERMMFYGSTSLASVTIGSSVASIGQYAFRGCTSLETLTFKGDVAPALDTSRFVNVPTSGTLYYPEGATGYDPAVFQAAGLPSGWTFEAVPGTTSPEPEVGEPGSGDLDGSGVTTSGALQVARAVISGTADWSEAKIDAADIDRDGVLTMSDVIRILRLAAGLT